MNPVQQKLKIIAKHTVSADRLKQHSHYIVFSIYSRTNAILAAFAGAGIANPFIDLGKNGSSPATIESLTHSFTSGFIPAIGIFCFVFWIIFTALATYDDGVKRATLMRSCNREMMIQRARVEAALNEANPMRTLEDIYQQLRTIYDRNNQEGSWPWPGRFAPNIDDKVNSEVETWLKSWQENSGVESKLEVEDVRIDG
jgi:hypothetical protein